MAHEGIALFIHALTHHPPHKRRAFVMHAEWQSLAPPLQRLDGHDDGKIKPYSPGPMHQATLLGLVVALSNIQMCVFAWSLSGLNLPVLVQALEGAGDQPESGPVWCVEGRLRHDSQGGPCTTRMRSRGLLWRTKECISRKKSTENSGNNRSIVLLGHWPGLEALVVGNKGYELGLQDTKVHI
jgi:hypothetical protein|eukprot:evm.model.NODE_32902_length_36922_cov_39.382481.2